MASLCFRNEMPSSTTMPVPRLPEVLEARRWTEHTKVGHAARRIPIMVAWKEWLCLLRCVRGLGLHIKYAEWRTTSRHRWRNAAEVPRGLPGMMSECVVCAYCMLIIHRTGSGRYLLRAAYTLRRLAGKQKKWVSGEAFFSKVVSPKIRRYESYCFFFWAAGLYGIVLPPSATCNQRNNFLQIALRFSIERITEEITRRLLPAKVKMID